MKIQQHVMIICSIFACTNLSYASNPASITYVDQKVLELQSQIAAIPAGPQGPAGPTGATGEGIPVGGVTGQILAKTSSANYDTQWVDSVSYTVGEQAMGGIVFWVDSTGQHGLIASTNNNVSSVDWGEASTTLAQSNGLFAGKNNTAVALASQAASGTVTSSPFITCSTYAIETNGTTSCDFSLVTNASTCYGDWYVPSSYELSKMYLANTTASLGMTGSYWSSTEVSSANAYLENFNSSGTPVSTIKSTPAAVRCIRSF